MRNSDLFTSMLITLCGIVLGMLTYIAYLLICIVIKIIAIIVLFLYNMIIIY